MRLSVVILITCAMSMGHFAWSQQEPVYSWGEPCTNDHVERRIDQLLSLGDNGFALLRSVTDNTYTTTYWIEEYNEQLALQGTQKVSFSAGVMGNSYDIEDVLAVNGKIYAFVTHWEKAYGYHSLSVKQLNMDGSMTDLADLDNIDAQKLGNKGQYEISFSEDGSKLVVMAQLPFVKKSNEIVRLSCFEVSTMKKLWSIERALEWPSKRAYNNEVVVTNSGGVLLFKKIWTKPIWKYDIYTCSGGSDLAEYTNLSLEGKEIIDYSVLTNQNGEVFIYATTSNKSSGFEKKVHGAWFAKFDSNLDLKTVKQADWSSDILTRALGDRQGSKGGAYLSDYSLKDVIFRQDGKLIVLLEKTKESKSGIAGTQPVKYSYEWNYGGVLALCLDPESGDVIWSQAFNKKQTVKNNESWDEFGSFVYHMKENRLSILWNNTPLSVASIPPASWTEPDGTKYVKRKAFGEKSMHATFLRVIEPDGSLAYDRKFGLPLLHLHDGAVFEMSLTTPFFFELNGTLVVMSAMHNGGKRYRFGFINL